MLAVATSFSDISGYADQGFSGQGISAASYINEEMKGVSKYLHESSTFGLIGRGTLQELRKTFEECSSEGWDGERAKPITKEVLRTAKIFLWSLPLGIESPEISAEPDGAISLEWYRSLSRVISISINPDRCMYYAVVIGIEEDHGRGPALFGVSDKILALIEEVTREIT